ncbi:HD domain-containing protein [Geomonas agri]|uniref:HD domain-containing protein n=1 Tax=Geomonas agri TaxID=2873702 RepID=UPI001CD7BDF4|nr:HD domain-containing protein [Geomonas agri]
MFKHEEIEKFWREIQWFREDRKAAAEVLLRKLDKGGDISTVVTFFWSESPYVKVNLIDHTIGVARMAMKLDKHPEFSTYQLLVLAALGHDICKMRGYINRKKDEYYEGVHAIVSARRCQEWLRDYLQDQEELDMVVKAIDLHHEPGHEQEKTVLGFLIRADKAARQNELNQMPAKELKGRRMIERGEGPESVKRECDLPPIQAPDPYAEKLPFFEPVEFLVRLLPEINSMDAYTGKGPEAVSMPSGVCYVTTYRAFKIVREWGHEVGHGELVEAIARDMNRRNNVAHFIGHQLREFGALAEHELPPNEKYTHRKFRVITQYNTSKTSVGMFYIPIRTRSLGGDIVALEKRKKGSPLLRNITKIYPNTGLWKKGRKKNG